MQKKIVIPEKIKVGFVNRSDTYDGKLSYVIYFDNKGVLRKEASFDSWRNKEIPALDFDNVPTSGFVLNKKAGGYSTGWNHRNTYVRIYDPRGFEYEITIPNLIYILENTNSIKGKGLEGEFVYGWAGKELILVPTSAPEYLDLMEFNTKLANPNSIKAKDLVMGATYLLDDNHEWMYMGRFPYYHHGDRNTGLRYYFSRKSSSSDYRHFQAYTTVSKKVLSLVTEDTVPDYESVYEGLDKGSHYFFSPHDPTKDEYVPLDLETFLSLESDRGFYANNLFTSDKVPVMVSDKREGHYTYSYSKTIRTVTDKRTDTIIFEGRLEELYEKIKPMFLNVYRPDGTLYKEKAQYYNPKFKVEGEK